MKNKLTVLLCIVLMAIAAQARAVDYSLPDMNGQMQSMDQYRGKWVIVNYWATWCATCRKELPDLIALQEKYKSRNVVVVGVNFDVMETSALAAFVKARGINYPVLRSLPVNKTPLGPVPALPVTYIISPEGVAVAGEIGLVSKEGLEDYLASKGVAASSVSSVPDGV